MTPHTRIQRKNRQAILDAALDLFSQYGFRGTTLDQIARQAGLSKPNLLYYFPSKEKIHTTLLEGLLDHWVDPLKAMDPDGNPEQEILGYVHRKLELSREFPRESRLFANEVLQGAPHIRDIIEGDMKHLVDAKIAIIQGWIDAGKINAVHPYHLIFSIWAITQHYADFDMQVQATLGEEGVDPYPQAKIYLTTLFTRLLAPE